MHLLVLVVLCWPPKLPKQYRLFMLFLMPRTLSWVPIAKHTKHFGHRGLNWNQSGSFLPEDQLSEHAKVPVQAANGEKQ